MFDWSKTTYENTILHIYFILTLYVFKMQSASNYVLGSVY